jgi:hypothetical protein
MARDVPVVLTPSSSDEVPVQCFTCYGEIAFTTCPECGFIQTVSKKWSAFTCGRCEATIELPRRWGYVPGAQAHRVQGAGQSWPKL